MNQERASKKQQELLSFVDAFIKEQGYGPSYREIMSGLGYKSVSTVAIHVDGLISKGYLARRDKSARSLEVVSLSPVSSIPKDDKNTTIDIQTELIKRIHTMKPEEVDRDTLRQAAIILDFPELERSLMKESNETTTE